MAPPSPRRPGFSRRAQYSLFTGYVFAVLGGLFGLLLIVTARLDPAGHSIIQGYIADIFSPISMAGRSVVRGGQNAVEEVGSYVNAASKNREMSEELKQARTRLIKGQADALENARLKRLLDFVQHSSSKGVVSHIVSSTGASSRRYATFSAGASDGVSNGQPVRGPEGLIGRVVQTGQIVSRILLITDAENVVPVKRVTDGVPALAIGNGSGALELRSLVGGDPFRIGDVFVTSGTGGIFEPGIPVAIAVRHGRDKTIARPLANPASLDFAVALPAFMPELPAAPSDLPSAK